MGSTVTISGIYRNPQTQPLPGATLIFETIYNSTQTQLQTTVSTITEGDGSYSISLVPNTYAVCEFASGRKKWLGNIQVFSDSVPGTLNEYLTNFQPDQSSIGSAGEAAASAAAAADSAAAAKQSEENAENYAKAAADSAAAVNAIKSPGDPGTYIFASTSLSTTGTPGSVYKGLGYTSGAHITPACLFQDVSGETDWVSIKNQRPDPPLAGTWSCCGVVVIGFSVTMWLRVDSPELLASGLRATLGQQRVRNCCYANPEGTAINCEISTTRGWLPFTATPDDSTEWGPKIYAAAVAGEYGEVSAYNDV